MVQHATSVQVRQLPFSGRNQLLNTIALLQNLGSMLPLCEQVNPFVAQVHFMEHKRLGGRHETRRSAVRTAWNRARQYLIRYEVSFHPFIWIKLIAAPDDLYSVSSIN